MKKFLGLAILMVVCSTFASATSLGTSWTTFSWDQSTAPAVGGNPFTFTGAGRVDVVDCCVYGDRFAIYDGATLLGTTSVGADSGSCFDGDSCWAGTLSKGSFALGAGSHSISIFLIQYAPGFELGPGSGFIRVPEPGSLALLGAGFLGLGLRRRKI
jgi:hypothetical protein